MASSPAHQPQKR